MKEGVVAAKTTFNKPFEGGVVDPNRFKSEGFILVPMDSLRKGNQ